MGLFDEFGTDLGGLLGEGSTDWMDLLANLGLDQSGGDMVYDTLTGQMVDAATVDPSLIDEAMGLFGDSTDFGDSADVGNVSGGPSGTSLSDTLRSRAADSMTEGTEAFDPSRMADPSASIASAPSESSNDWMKALAKGISGLLPAATKGLSGLMAPSSSGGIGGGSLAGLMAAPSVPGFSSGGGSGGGGGAFGTSGGGDSYGAPSSAAAGLMQPDTIGAPASLGAPGTLRPDQQAPIEALLSRLQADAQRVGLQPGVERQPIPAFTPLNIPITGAGPIQAIQGGQPALSGLQRLLQERRG